MSKGINESLASATTSAQVPAKQGAFQISGTFVGTVQLQRLLGNPGIWQPIAEYTVPTVTTDEVSFDNGVAQQMRFEVTAYTSGTIAVDLAALLE